MKKNFLMIASLLIGGQMFAQVGINNASPNATLDIAAKTNDGSKPEGLIAPRLTGDQIQLADSRYGASQTGSIVYATSGVTVSTTKTAKITAGGYYYFDGTLWQPVEIRMTADNGLTRTGEKIQLGGALTQPTTLSGVTATNKLAITATGVDAINLANSTLSIDASNNRIGVGTAAPNAKLGIRTNPASQSNPGEGFIGLGTTTVTAASAGAGALRYLTGSGGILQYSNGVSWNTLAGNVQKSIVVAKKTTAQTIPSSPNAGQSVVVDWVGVTDINGDFNAATGIFTAPRDGNYTVSFSFNFAASTINAGTQVEAILVSSGGSANDKKSVVAFPAAGTSQCGSSISFTIRLNSGETVRPFIWHNTGSDKTLRVGTGGDDGFVNFSVAEL